jgi:ribose 5-phosphate isomerase B
VLGGLVRSSGCQCATLGCMKVALGADENTHLVEQIARHLEARGHAVTRFGAAAGKGEPWARTAERVGESVARREHDFGVVCCWTGTGVSIAANKVRGIRAALCADAETARGARQWNDANVLALSLRATSEQVAREILDAWLSEPYGGSENDSLDAIRECEER